LALEVLIDDRPFTYLNDHPCTDPWRPWDHVMTRLPLQVEAQRVQKPVAGGAGGRQEMERPEHLMPIYILSLSAPARDLPYMLCSLPPPALPPKALVLG
jgi:hypothetical protein